MAGVSETVSVSITIQEMINCSMSVWYPKFKDITFKSDFIPLSVDFIHYLKSDGIFLPHGCDPPAHDESETGGVATVLGESSSSSSDSDSEDCNHDNRPYFPAIVEKIETAIAQLGGRVVPKLNWSAPRDAVWLLPGNTLECRTPGDVILLLKSSHFVSHDILHAFDECSDTEKKEEPVSFTLCLRQWVEFHPSAEFRCFVHNQSLIAISQREVSSCYDHLLGCRDDIKHDIIEFFQSHIRDKYPDPNYVFDVLWRVSEGEVLLVDFNPYCSKTDPLLFLWEELVDGCVPGNGGGTENNDGETPVIRLVEDKALIRSHDLQVYRYPQDAVDLTRGEDIHKLVDLLRLREERGNDSDSSS